MRLKKLKPCPWCDMSAGLTMIFNHQFIEICCANCKLVRQIEYPKTTIDKTTKQERETTETERQNYAIEKWNEYEKHQTKLFTDGLMKGYTLGVEDAENGEPFKFWSVK